MLNVPKAHALKAWLSACDLLGSDGTFERQGLLEEN
jgi:hypothetical protein